MKSISSPLDVLLTLLWGVVIFVLAIGYRNNLPINDPRRPFVLPALGIKMFSGILVGVVYDLYYYGGDTFIYYNTASNLALSAIDNLSNAFDIYFTNTGFENLPYHVETYVRHGLYYNYYADSNAYFVSKVVSYFSFIGFLSYYPTTVIVASFTFLGVWLLFSTLVFYLPRLSNLLALAVFFVPSVFFWGSGILKDSFALSFLGIFFFSIHQSLARRKFFWAFLFLALVCFYIVLRIKPYIILSFVIFLTYWLLTLIPSKLGAKGPAKAYLPVLLLLFLLFAAGLTQYLSDALPQYSLERILEESTIKRKDLTSAYYYADGIGSSYDIGEAEPTLAGAVSKFPISVWTTFFRPYPWEVRNSVMVFAAIESVLLFALTVYILLQVGLGSFTRIAFQYPLVTFMLAFSIVFAFFCGFSSGNFGNLVRYKIPCMPFFVASLFIIQYIRQEERKQLAALAHPSTAKSVQKTVA